MDNEHLRRQFARRAHACEQDIRGLVGEILTEIPGGRERRKPISDRLTMLMASIEDAIWLDATATVPARDRRIRDLHEKMDEIISGKAELDRARRDIYREMEDLDIEEKKTHARQIRDEADRAAEL